VCVRQWAEDGRKGGKGCGRGRGCVLMYEVPRGREGGQTKKGGACRAGVHTRSGRRGGGRGCVCATGGGRWQKGKKGV
jgi:hypothetical protein